MTADEIERAYQRRYERTGMDPDGLYGPQACRMAGHVPGCPGKAGGSHEYIEPWSVPFNRETRNAWLRARRHDEVPEASLLEASPRFWSQVEKTDECWLWTGAINRKGYGWFVVKSRRFFAHRFALMVIGAEVDGLTVDHLCRTPACVRPDHLELVPMAVNVARGVSFSAVNARKTHCVNGHEFTPENTRMKRQAGRLFRQCRECRKAADRRRWPHSAARARRQAQRAS